jgi:hypothetical protein
MRVMQRQIRHVPDGIVLDLDRPDLGHPDGVDILLHHYRQSSTAGMHDSQTAPAFICMKHENGTYPGLYLKKTRRGEWFAVHYVGDGSCGPYRLPSPMSDEHKRQAEYWARAAQDSGYDVETEWRLHTGTRPDVFIRGPNLTGVEVQRSLIKAVTAVDRTRQAEAAGVRDLWFTDNTTRPEWFDRVPSVGQNVIPGYDPWRHGTPPRRSVTATNLRRIVPVRCTVSCGYQCANGRNFCGRYHPRSRPWTGFTVDDVAAQIPAGDMVAIRLLRPGRKKPGDIAIVPPVDQRLYEEMTGVRATPLFIPAAGEPPPRHGNGVAECMNRPPTRLPPASAAEWAAMPRPVPVIAPGRTQRAEAAVISAVDPAAEFYCDPAWDGCGRMHAIGEHRHCRALMSWRKATTSDDAV